VSPYDTGWSSGLRFAIEIVAWVTGPWAAAVMTDSGWAAVPVAVVLVGLPALFNTPGDKKATPIPTPGPLRILIEMLLLAVAVVATVIVLPTWAAVAVSVVGAGMLLAGRGRYRWLAAGAGPVPPSPVL